ncbi:MAG: tRNA (N(6)-L-threonylcarbamoyladenosine(37)-C(2))-methylthiotransferase MtaB [Clostridia bacterium]|nr:tRNA (N(6)-L-threonylcarbamoyladenosine(37)-C(2))-methylthiotransferase MtaB [Clostridia bacterium]
MKVAFLTLGCRVNQYETQVIREALINEGFEEVPFDGGSDLYVLNTCAVTGESERKGRQMLRRALRQKEKNPAAVVCVCGCFAQGAKSDPLFAQADVVTGNTGKGRLAQVLASLCKTPPHLRSRMDLRQDIEKVREYEPMSLCRSHNARAFLKIQDGCNSFCSYCFVPFVRGRVRSRPTMEVVEEAKRLADSGYREIVLTGIETGAYGIDLKNEDGLLSLVESVHGVSGVERIRFGSLKPTLITDEFCARLAALPKVMPHFHLSLQSGSTAVLSAMGRRYGREEEEKAVDTVYRYFPDAGLSADLICGFPGETETDFMESVSLVQRSRLLHTHIFPFSPREGTKAATLSGQIHGEEKKRRAAYLLEVARKSSEDFADRRVGREYRVLAERIRDGFVFGYTDNFIYTKTPAASNLRVGDVFSVTLEKEKNFSVETMTVTAKNTKNG